MMKRSRTEPSTAAPQREASEDPESFPTTDLIEFEALEIDSGGSDNGSEDLSSTDDSDSLPEDLDNESREEDFPSNEEADEDSASIDLEEIKQQGEEILKAQEQCSSSFSRWSLSRRIVSLGIDWVFGMSQEAIPQRMNERTGTQVSLECCASWELKMVATVGDVPLKWYQHEDHIGYDLHGKKITKSERKDRLDRLLEKMDKDGLVTSFHDPYNDEEVQISREDLRMLMNIKKGKLPDAQMEPYLEYPNWFSSKIRIHPLSNALKPKSRYRTLPVKYEERKVAQLVQAIKSGKIKEADRVPRDPDVPYMIWAEDGRYEREGSRLAYLQPPKKPLPGHDESFHPPKEYLPTKAMSSQSTTQIQHHVTL